MSATAVHQLGTTRVSLACEGKVQIPSAPPGTIASPAKPPLGTSDLGRLFERAPVQEHQGARIAAAEARGLDATAITEAAAAVEALTGRESGLIMREVFLSAAIVRSLGRLGGA
jgi:hypothetical protein